MQLILFEFHFPCYKLYNCQVRVALMYYDYIPPQGKKEAVGTIFVVRKIIKSLADKWVSQICQKFPALWGVCAHNLYSLISFQLHNLHLSFFIVKHLKKIFYPLSPLPHPIIMVSLSLKSPFLNCVSLAKVNNEVHVARNKAHIIFELSVVFHLSEPLCSCSFHALFHIIRLLWFFFSCSLAIPF